MRGAWAILPEYRVIQSHQTGGEDIPISNYSVQDIDSMSQLIHPAKEKCQQVVPQVRKHRPMNDQVIKTG